MIAPTSPTVLTAAALGQARLLTPAKITGDGGPFSTESDEDQFLLRHVYMGNGLSPLPELAGTVYNDDQSYSLLGLINATPDVVGEGAGYPFFDQVPQVGYALSDPSGWVDRPIQVSYSVSGAEFAIINPGSDTWTVSYSSQFQAQGMRYDILDKLSWVYLVPVTGASSLTVTATTEDDLIHLTGGVVDSVTPTAVTLTMPVTTPANPDPELLTSLVSLVGGGAEAGTPGAPVGGADNVSSGIKWQTLAPKGETTRPYQTRTGNIDIKYKTFTVETVTGEQITVAEPLPLANQPAATRDYVTANGRDITYNCHGFSFGMVGVAGHNFWLIDASEVNKLIKGGKAIYEKVAMKDARPGDVVVYWEGQSPEHSMVLVTAGTETLPSGAVVLDRQVKVKTKSGIMPLAQPTGQPNDPTLISTLRSFTRALRADQIEVYRLKQ
jgi:hypothetical protein